MQAYQIVQKLTFPDQKALLPLGAWPSVWEPQVASLHLGWQLEWGEDPEGRAMGPPTSLGL